MAATLIRVSSRALGQRQFIRVYIYDTIEELRAAGERFSPGENYSDAYGLHQSYRRERYEDGTWSIKSNPYIIRLWRELIGSNHVTHEVVHAAQAIYGDTLNGDEQVTEIMHGGNEPFAYLVSDLCSRLVNRMYALGFYE